MDEIVTTREFLAHKVTASLPDCVAGLAAAVGASVALTAPNGPDGPIASVAFLIAAPLAVGVVAVIVWRYMRSSVYRDGPHLVVRNPYRTYRLVNDDFPILMPRRLLLTRVACLVDADLRQVTVVALPASAASRLDR